MRSRIIEGHGVFSSSHPPQCKFLSCLETMTEFSITMFWGQAAKVPMELKILEEKSGHHEHIIEATTSISY